MRLSSSSPRRRLQAIEAGQLVLPFLVESEGPMTSASIEQEGGVTASRMRRLSAENSRPHNSNSQNLRDPKSKEKNGKRKPARKATVPPDSKLLVSRLEAAEIVSLSVRSIDNLLASKQLSFRRIGTRVLIPVTELRKFVRVDHPDRMAS
ncbi:MAG TPA: helix-turn-helix domain-containing protein [Terracidiphilus sp.]|nr:helix-turn-helix domain-containing protein [Terracidiphilus sp.]